MKLLKSQQALFFNILVLFTLGPWSGVSGHEKGQNHYLDARTAHGLKELLHYTGNSVPFLSSHRGGPEKDMPENCIATFANTLKHTYSMMEIDPRYTKDSIMVIHHDPTLQRTTTGSGRVMDFTLKELKALRLKDTEGNVTSYSIPTFEEVLKWAKGKTILVIDKKDVPIEARVKMVEKYKAESYCIIMAYTCEEAKICYQMNTNIVMEIFVPTPEKADEFEKSGVPWENVVAFISHQKPNDPAIIKILHDKGARCILGTSRNLDREFAEGKVADMEGLKDDYNTLIHEGIDILETDIPVPVSKVLDHLNSIDPSIRKYFRNK